MKTEISQADPADGDGSGHRAAYQGADWRSAERVRSTS